MKFIGRLLGGRIALALDGVNVHKNGLVELSNAPKSFLHRLDVVPVDRTDVDEAERLENAAGAYRRLDAVLDAVGGVQNPVADGRDRDALDKSLEVLFGLTIARRETNLRKIFAEGADVFVDGHFVIVENDDEIFFELTGVIERLERLAARQSAVADDRDHIVMLAVELGGNQKPERGGDRSRGVPDSEGVILRFGAFREAADAAEGSEGTEFFSA